MVTAIDYALISGIQIDPAQYSEGNTTNPMNGISSAAGGRRATQLGLSITTPLKHLFPPIPLLQLHRIII
jgi:hypothetical protein